jgi:hypothetical protein
MKLKPEGSRESTGLSPAYKYGCPVWSMRGSTVRNWPVWGS